MIAMGGAWYGILNWLLCVLFHVVSFFGMALAFFKILFCIAAQYAYIWTQAILLDTWQFLQPLELCCLRLVCDHVFVYTRGYMCLEFALAILSLTAILRNFHIQSSCCKICSAVVAYALDAPVFVIVACYLWPSFPWAENRRFEIYETCDDGACALHALFGSFRNGKYFFENARFILRNLLPSTFAEFRDYPTASFIYSTWFDDFLVPYCRNTATDEATLFGRYFERTNPDYFRRLRDLIVLQDQYQTPPDFLDKSWPVYLEMTQHACYWFSIPELLLIADLAKLHVKTYLHEGDTLTFSGENTLGSGTTLHIKLTYSLESRRTHFERMDEVVEEPSDSQEDPAISDPVKDEVSGKAMNE